MLHIPSPRSSDETITFRQFSSVSVLFEDLVVD